MKYLLTIISFLKEWCFYIKEFFKSFFTSRMEIVMLRAQIAEYENAAENSKFNKSDPTPAFRHLAVLFSKLHSRSKLESVMKYVKPATVISWHDRIGSLIWLKKCGKKGGRPPITEEMIELIKEIHEDNKLLSPEKIHEKLCQMNVKNPPSPNTIAKYLPETRKPDKEKQRQSWRTFLKNHMHETWGADFFTVNDIKFNTHYVLIIINHETRELIHFGVTQNPTVRWTIRQFKEATPFDIKPRFLVHDNDSVFRSKLFQDFLSASNIESVRTAYQAPWQNPYAERAIGIIRQELGALYN